MHKQTTLLAGVFVALLSSVASAGDEQTTNLHVKGMTCAACPVTVKQVLKKIPGVTAVNVDLKSQSALVKFDSEKTQPYQLAKAVTDVGFPATVKK